jgi:VanZ family protein
MRAIFSPNPSPVPEPRLNARWWLAVWVPVALALCVIAIESTGTFSSQNTSEWLRPVFEKIFGPLTDGSWDLLHHYLRKTGHFVGYGTVGFTFLRAWLLTRGRGGVTNLLAWRAECSVLAILSTAIVASCDELHQAVLAGRTGTPMDVLLDTSGACTLCLLVWATCWRSRRREGQPVGSEADAL